jgi:putative IMPACT (imprinted ancient) family translation regulator
VGEVVAVCTRYYGGVKLGTGGLSRAYSGGVVLGLSTLPTEEKVERVAMELTVGYPEVDAVQRLIRDAELPILDEAFGAEVRYRLGVPVEEVEALRRRVADLTRRGGTLREVESDREDGPDREAGSE